MTFLFQLVLKNQNCTFSGADPGFSEGEGGLGGGGEIRFLHYLIVIVI